MTKHLDEARDRWAKEFKKRVARMEKMLTDKEVEDRPTPLTEDESSGERLGSTFDSFLEEEGIKEEVDEKVLAALANKR